MVSQTLRRPRALDSASLKATGGQRAGLAERTREALTPEAAMNLVCALILSTFSAIVFAFFRPEAVDGVFYLAFAAWFSFQAYHLRAGIEGDEQRRWMQRSGWTAAILFSLAALSFPMAIGDRDYACMVACSVLMAPTAAIAGYMFLKTR